MLRAARAHAKPSYQTVIDRLSHGIELKVPDPYSADEATLATYLQAIGRVVVESRFVCNALFDLDETPYGLIASDEPGAARLVSPGCEAAHSLLDAVDDNVTNMLVAWGTDFWCRPRCLFDNLRRHEIEYESGLARFTGFLSPADTLAPVAWACDR